MGERQFAPRVKGKKAFVIEGAGAKVDTQKPDEAIKLFKAVLQEKFPNTKIDETSMMSGRFGLDKRKGWEFDATMAGSGHPDSWIPGSRGYYALLKNTVFFFPKSDAQFKNDKYEDSTYWRDLESALSMKLNGL